MYIVTAVVLLVGWLGTNRAQQAQQGQTMQMDAPLGMPITVHVSDQKVDLDFLGLSVFPTDGWHHLSIRNVGNLQVDHAVFVNQKTNAIATLTPSDRAMTVRQDASRYGEVEVLWSPEVFDRGGMTMAEGLVRLSPDSQPNIHIEVMSKDGIGEDSSLSKLLSAIDPH